MKLTIYQAVLSAALNAHKASGPEKLLNSKSRPSFRAHGKNLGNKSGSRRWSGWGIFSRKPGQIATHFFCLWLVACILTWNNALGWIFGSGALIMLVISLVSSMRMPWFWETPYQKNRDSSLAKECPALSWPALDTVYTKLGLMNNLRDVSFASQEIDMINYNALLDSYGLNGAVVIDFTTFCDEEHGEETNATGDGLLWQYADGRVVIISLVNIAKTADLIHAVGEYCVNKGEVDLTAGQWVSCELENPAILVGREWYDLDVYLRKDFLNDISDAFQGDDDSVLRAWATGGFPSQRNEPNRSLLMQTRFLLNAF